MKFLFRTPLIPFILVPLLVGQPVWAQAPVSSTSDETSGGTNLQLRVVGADSSRVPANSQSAKGFTIQVTDLHGAPVPEAAVAFRLPDSGSSGAFPDGSHSAVVYTDNTGNAHVDGIRWSETPGVAALRITASKGNEHAGLLVEQTLLTPGISPVTALAEPVRSTPLPPPPAVLETAAPPIAPVMRTESAPGKPVGLLSTAPSVSVESLGRKGAVLAGPLNAQAEPSVSIVSSPQENSIGGSKKKWIVLGIVIAAGAGAGFAFASKGAKSSSTATAPSSISFGSPTVSVGHP
ncbi:MAG: hypothetical protein ACJ73N_11480 [Bryobacteraceae bacterium]